MDFRDLTVSPKKSAALVGLMLCAAVTHITAKPTPAYTGTWVLNQAETELLRDDLDEKTIKIPTAGRTQISLWAFRCLVAVAVTRAADIRHLLPNSPKFYAL